MYDRMELWDLPSDERTIRVATAVSLWKYALRRLHENKSSFVHFGNILQRCIQRTLRDEESQEINQDFLEITILA